MDRKIRGPLTLDLCDMPTPTPPLAGNPDLDVALRHALSDVLKYRDLAAWGRAAYGEPAKHRGRASDGREKNKTPAHEH